MEQRYSALIAAMSADGGKKAADTESSLVATSDTAAAKVGKFAVVEFEKCFLSTSWSQNCLSEKEAPRLCRRV